MKIYMLHMKTYDNYIQQGFSLIEVLVALIILSIGLLGIAGLQITSKQTNFEAVQRTTATMLARDMIERMRVNASELAAYTNSGSGFAFTPESGITTAATDCSSSSCNTTTMVNYDLYEWEKAIAGTSEVSSGGANTGGLVSPTGCISVPAGAPAGTVTVAIAWRGMTNIGNPVIDTCGDATGLYDDTAGDNAFRRVLVVTTFISD